ncbi:hypothetical protein L596_000436 [Steinernema carpocapsae]|uniref:Golgin subfamily A conserved domain-containing protein n=1 Tax=Steinernema carpocapsae TaxID=34508 RepID=A0A4U8UMC0_STECR|nr:hypothetical protein L596_000436 [Steinernema carpocapsae]
MKRISHEDTPHSYSQRQTPELRHEGHESSSDCSEAHQTVEKLRVHLSRAQRDYNALHEKHQELVSHYSNLHSTYEQLLNNPPVSKSTEAQITKLQAALTAAVEEKTTLQGTLRSNDQRISDLMDQVKQLEHIVEEAKSHQASTDAAPEPISIVQESQIRKMESEIQTLHGTISRQQEELIRMHKDGANMEVRIQRMQQDQNDAQARLRMAYRDNEQKAELVSGLQKKCELLEIHVGQMREHGIGPDGSMGLIDENSQLKEKLSDLITENDDLKKQVDAARVYYDSYKMDLDERMTELTKQFNDQHELLQQRTDELNMATDQICDMKLELQTMQDKQNSSRDGSPESDTLQNEFEALQEYAKDLHNKYTVACDKQQESISEYLRVKNAYEALKTSYETCEVQLDEERRSLRRLKEATENTQLINTDIRSLTEQLANEKATVSRAVSQNSELKEQLIEMEDKPRS